MSSQLLWEHPDVQSTRMDVFRRHVNRKYNLRIQSYAELHAWSVEKHIAFAQEIWDFCGVQVSAAPLCVGTGLDRMWPRPQWFPGARLNYTENLIAVGLALHPTAIAISACRERESDSRHVTWVQLRHEVEKWTSALRNAGVQKGDRVAGTDPMITSARLLLTGFPSCLEQFYRVRCRFSGIRSHRGHFLFDLAGHGRGGNRRKI